MSIHHSYKTTRFTSCTPAAIASQKNSKNDSFIGNALTGLSIGIWRLPVAQGPEL